MHFIRCNQEKILLYCKAQHARILGSSPELLLKLRDMVSISRAKDLSPDASTTDGILWLAMAPFIPPSIMKRLMRKTDLDTFVAASKDPSKSNINERSVVSDEMH